MGEEAPETGKQALRERLLYLGLEICSRGALPYPGSMDAFLAMVTKLEEFVEKPDAT